MVSEMSTPCDVGEMESNYTPVSVLVSQYVHTCVHVRL